ncbi:SDR family oxidoreductase [Paraferrimonas sedimenticola]|uniref:Short-chain dehydrogenase n=1 Tax=Paraferrimonas sedimenticola TaxID=375674 RepID=A0AA37RUL0_9GAMM|nr:SDR family oxidoreductase [Paraferrimonas sedimenticola]GLP95448.1 short-chain dehydrogenase [Paraferrimonas sedimenticola]
MPRLNNKIALITGAARGIGEATAELFAAEGATVIISDIQDDLGQAVASRVLKNSEYLHLDVSDERDWADAENHIQIKYGRLDILVNNAGITGFLETNGPHDPESFDIESWRKVHEVNSVGVALGCRTAIKLMKSSKAGSIVNLSSRSGIVGIPGAAAYASSKASVRNHSKTVALYCAEKGYQIRCNSIHPGAILTPMWDAMLGEGKAKEEAINAIAADIPLGTMGSTMDVAYAALYLASDESKYVTGIELNIDGGILAGSAASPNKK